MFIKHIKKIAQNSATKCSVHTNTSESNVSKSTLPKNVNIFNNANILIQTNNYFSRNVANGDYFILA